MSVAECVELEPPGKPIGSVIWLHGLGADGHDFEPIVPELRLPEGINLRFVFPHAPLRPVSINGGLSMRAWFDILTLDRGGPIDADGIRDSSKTMVELIEREYQRGVPYEKIVLAGFSQGGAIAMHTAIRFSQPLGGLMALSTYLPLQQAMQAEISNAASSQPTNLPVFMAHGSLDPVLPLALGEAARDTLQAAGFAVAWHEYPMQHALCAEEIDAIRNWLLGLYAAVT